MNKWYVIYTNHHHEKKTVQLLQQNGIECFLPLHKVRKKWSDRIKIVEVPLFKSYVFVRITEDEKLKVREAQGVINFVYWLGKPAIVRDSEIEIIKKFIGEYQNIIVKPIKLKVNDKVKVDSGPMMDYTGKILKCGKNKVKVIFDSFGIELRADIHINNLVPLPD
ncbi:MAG: UpxY family transcription antiterminator [Bacteroidetes bacterium]|nr:UpxY family transcription antiterminator [Bacteroidota bacterium]